MTRITSFGRKRTYVEAGFGQAEAELNTSIPNVSSERQGEPHKSAPSGLNEAVESAPPKKKKRIRTPKHKRDNYVPPTPAEDAATSMAKADTQDKELSNTKLRKKEKTKVWREKMETARKPAEKRQTTRIDSRHPRRSSNKDSNTTCLACRKQGHKAADCPAAKSGSSRAVGICYRCGSTSHSLFKCPHPADPSNPMPFASCFVCRGAGHLASACPQNAGKGIYPNGGCCKLCGENTHLAKDCQMKSQNAFHERERPTHRQGVAGADEDDFHISSARANDITHQKRLTVTQTSEAPEKRATQSTTNKRKTVFF